MSKTFNLTPRAKQDLHGIWDYTYDTWGEAQADKYITALYKRFDRLAKQSLIGRHRTDIQEGYYCFPQESHLVFYVIFENSIDIIGIPHKEMDIINYF